jgi:hypothetical protein
MKNAVGFCLLIVISAATVSGQSHPKAAAKIRTDFSGTWLLDRSKSSAELTNSASRSIKILHQDPEFQLIRDSEINGQTKTLELTYYTDGRGEKNKRIFGLLTSGQPPKALNDNELTESHTVWNGNKLVTRSTFSTTIAGRRLEFEEREEWKLSKDGMTLTQTSSMIFRQGDGTFIPANRPDMKSVYNRLPD